MSAAAPALKLLTAWIADRSEALGASVEADVSHLVDRGPFMELGPPGEWSANRACRMVRATDGWIAVNLARPEDRDLLPAWLGCGFDAEPWECVVTKARERSRDDLIAGASLLGLPAAGVGEVATGSLEVPLIRYAAGYEPATDAAPAASLRVVDLSAMWAGPLCGAIFAGMGATVLKIEDLGRPDAVRGATPGFYERLNGAKRLRQMDFKDDRARAQLRKEILSADVLITSARPRAFGQLGLDPAATFAANPGLVWVAITGYGWRGAAANRVAFGDDAAAAGGLVGWTKDGVPLFVGDAVADPLTGLAAAAGALRGLMVGRGVLVDAALAPVAAGATALEVTHQVA